MSHATALAAMAARDEVRRAAAVSAGSVTVLTSLLGQGTPASVVEEVVSALLALSQSEEGRAAIATSGAIGALATLQANGERGAGEWCHCRGRHVAIQLPSRHAATDG